jgi:putative sigma-54 modulation protein
MNVAISGRHIDVTDAIRNHVQSGLERIRRHFDRVIDVDVVLDVEKRKHRQMAEINLRANGLRINAKESSSDMYTSIDAAIAKIERQITKHKDRIYRHQPRTSREQREFHHNIVEIAPPAADATQENEVKHRVVHREKLVLQTMTVNEAAFQLELLDDAFLVFSNAETQQVNVVYPRHDGTYGLIEPQF